MAEPKYDCTAFGGATRTLCQQLNAVASEEAGLAETVVADTNDFFLIWGGALVLFMHAGFAMLSAGAVRSKNTKNILISISMDVCFCAIAWFLCGYAFAFGNDNDRFIGSSFWVGVDVGVVPASNGAGSLSHWFFEFAFAATSATIVSGAIAERARFETYCLYSFFLSIWVYPVVVHWVWGGGFLTLAAKTGGASNVTSLMGTGVVDFAGDGPVHMIGGLAGAIGSKIIGPRIGRFDEKGNPVPIPGHSASLATLGMFILWVGWFGFNCASVIFLTPGYGGLASRAGVNTVLSTAAAAIVAVFWPVAMRRFKVMEFDLGNALNGALSGLVSITGSACYVELWAAICIGLIGGLVYLGGVKLTTNIMKIDDPLDATAVHLYCGMWGLIAGAFFANPIFIEQAYAGAWPGGAPSGIFYGAGYTGALLGNAIVEIVCIIAWVGGFMTPLFLLLNHLGILRVSQEVEQAGLDESHHGGRAYPEDFTNPLPPKTESPLPAGTSSAAGVPATAEREVEPGMTIRQNDAIKEPFTMTAQ